MVEEIGVRHERELLRLAQVDGAREQHRHRPLEGFEAEGILVKSVGRDDVRQQRRVLALDLGAERVGGVQYARTLELRQVLLLPQPRLTDVLGCRQDVDVWRPERACAERALVHEEQREGEVLVEVVGDNRRPEHALRRLARQDQAVGHLDYLLALHDLLAGEQPTARELKVLHRLRLDAKRMRRTPPACIGRQDDAVALEPLNERPLACSTVVAGSHRSIKDGEPWCGRPRAARG